MTVVRDLAGERGAEKGGSPGPALSDRALPGYALPAVKGHIPELLSEGGSSSGSRLRITLRWRRFHPVARSWRESKRAVKTGCVLGFARHGRPDDAARSAPIGADPLTARPPEAS